MDQHTLEKLELPKIYDLVRGKTMTPFSKDEIDRLEPFGDKVEIDRRLNEIGEMMEIVTIGAAFPLSRMEDSREHLNRAKLEGIFIEPEAMLEVLELVEVSADVHGYDPEGRDNFPAVAQHIRGLRPFPELRKSITKAIETDGTVKDSASSQLKAIRLEFAATKRKIMATLDRILSGQPRTQGWQDDIVTQRAGRYVITIPSSQYRSDAGILHDRSQSGATYYVEPKETVDLNNQFNVLMQKERVEIDRILRAITADIAQRADALMENTRILGWLDFLYGAAKLSIQIKAIKPTIVIEPVFKLVKAKHPLLMVQSEDTSHVVPMSLGLDDNRRGIVVTGPNTGGKTVALKTVGLSVLMALSGLPIAAAPGTEIGLFKQVFADIGDEQSIELSLSTFSSHVRNIIGAVRNLTKGTLVLLDEIGAGTDPKEGAALAESIILFAMDRGAKLIATTHYSQLKSLPLSHPELENASLEFDRKSLRPTFELQLGIPGSSYAVEIAGRLGMPKEICGHATELLGTSERSLADLIASLEQELARVKEDRRKLTERLEKTKELEQYYQAQTEKFDREVAEERRKALEETERILDDTRRETERLVAEIRQSQAQQKTVKELHGKLRESRGRVDRARKRTKGAEAEPVDAGTFEPGDRVSVLSLKAEGELEALIGNDRARIRVGSVTMTAELRNLRKLGGPVEPKAKARVGAGSDVPSLGNLSPEIHLRGMTVEEATEALDQFLDRAVLGGLQQIYVIHGKGTGKLRRTLTEYLRKHRDVADVRLGNWNEGGAGVTVVKLKT